MTRNLTNAIVASPDQSSTVLGVGSAHPVRFKNVYVLRFVRKVDVATDNWKDGLTFIAKSIERPAISPVTEEINQYNRKRVIHTGVKYNPIACSLYDTADGSALSMWAQYANYYFGDFGHNPSDYADDILNGTMMGGTKYGYGIVTNPTSAEPNGINSQFFFDRVEVYQLWGGEFVSYQLINPRIAAFTPDDLDYEANAISMINMSLQFETVYYVNSGQPQNVSTNSFLSSIFSADFSGHTPEPNGVLPKQNDFTSTGAAVSSSANPISALTGLGSISNPNAFNISSADVQNSMSSGQNLGTISKYGSYNFGSYANAVTGLPTELSSMTGSSLLSNGGVISGFSTTATTTTPSLSSISAPASQFDTTQSQLGLASSLSDISQGVSLADAMSPGAAQSQVQTANWNNTSTVVDDFAMALDLPSSVPTPIPAPTDAVVISPKQDTAKVVSLGPIALATINTRSDGTSQLGVRQNSTNPLLNFLKEPTPHVYFTGHLTAATEQADTVASTSHLKIRAHFAPTEQSDSVVATSKLRIHGHAVSATTEQNDTLASTTRIASETAIHATGEVTESNDTVASSATVQTFVGIHGQASISEGDDLCTTTGYGVGWGETWGS